MLHSLKVTTMAVMIISFIILICLYVFNISNVKFFVGFLIPLCNLLALLLLFNIWCFSLSFILFWYNVFARFLLFQFSLSSYSRLWRDLHLLFHSFFKILWSSNVRIPNCGFVVFFERVFNIYHDIIDLI